MVGQIVVFKLMNHEFGIDIMRVVEILNYELVRPVPAVPAYAEEIINVRGTVYPIFNLCKRLNMSCSMDYKDSKFILLNLEEGRVGLLVDGVSEIMTVEEEYIEATPTVIDQNQESCIDYIVKKDDRIVIVLDIKAVVSEKENLYIQGVSDEEDYSSNTK
ncbi:MAG: purine-binding chemotaxis protein CheW [Cellulosilyticum sp.]|nr:purine-binding chemotaxis protein CheW [Cellulosilyticum sp.]